MTTESELIKPDPEIAKKEAEDTLQTRYVLYREIQAFLCGVENHLKGKPWVCDNDPFLEALQEHLHTIGVDLWSRMNEMRQELYHFPNR